LCLWLFLFAFPLPAVHADDVIRVGVAANFIQPFREIAQMFEGRFPCRVEAVFSSTGNLYAQVINGAPLDVFLAADEERPQRLFGEGLADAPFVYAIGHVVLCAKGKTLCSARDWKKAVQMPGIGKIAIASPETSPYGKAAMIALQKAGLWQHIQEKIVYAQDVTQVLQYVSTESIDAGFCALSAAFTDHNGAEGCCLTVEEAPPVVQTACTLRNARNPQMAKIFAAFLRSPEASNIKRKYGYR